MTISHESLAHSNILSSTAHFDDFEMHHLALTEVARVKNVLVATDGAASTLNFTSRCFC